MASFTVAKPALSLLAQTGTGGLESFLPLILMFLVFYVIVLRPMNKQEKDRRKRVQGLAKGDEVVVGGGILGKIVNMDDPNVAVVEIGDRTRIRVLRRDLVDSKEGALKALERGRPAAKTASKPASKQADDKSTESASKNA